MIWIQSLCSHWGKKNQMNKNKINKRKQTQTSKQTSTERSKHPINKQTLTWWCAEIQPLAFNHSTVLVILFLCNARWSKTNSFCARTCIFSICISSCKTKECLILPDRRKPNSVANGVILLSQNNNKVNGKFEGVSWLYIHCIHILNDNL